MTLKNNRAPLLSNIKLYASFHHHMWIQTGVTVRKRLSWVVTSVTLTFDLWPRPFAWTLLWSLVITPDNFMMIRWWEHSQTGVTDRQTDRRTDGRTDGQTENTICRAAWSQLKIQYSYQAAILKVTSVKINRLLPITTINMHMKFEIDIPKQTWLTSRKPCHLQSPETEKSNMVARRPFWKWRCWKSIGSYPYT